MRRRWSRDWSPGDDAPTRERTAEETCRSLATLDGVFNPGRYANLMRLDLAQVHESEAERIANDMRDRDG